MYRQLMDVQYFLSVVYHNLGMEKKRDEAIQRHFLTEEKRKGLEAIVVDEEVHEIWDVVTEVGAALAAR